MEKKKTERRRKRVIDSVRWEWEIMISNKVNKIALTETALSERSSKCIHSFSPLPIHSFTHSYP